MTPVERVAPMDVIMADSLCHTKHKLEHQIVEVGNGLTTQATQKQAIALPFVLHNYWQTLPRVMNETCIVCIGSGKAYRDAIEPGNAKDVAHAYKMDGWIVQRIGNVVRLVRRPMI